MQIRGTLCVILVSALALVACDGRRLNVLIERPAQISEDEIAGIDWTGPEDYRVTLVEFAVMPEEPTLTLGKPYRLEIRNIGDQTFNLAARDFFETAVVREMEVHFVELHGAKPHVEKPVAHYKEYPTGLDNDPATKAEHGESDTADSDTPETDTSGNESTGGEVAESDQTEAEAAEDSAESSETSESMVKEPDAKEMEADSGAQETEAAEVSDAEPSEMPAIEPVRIDLVSVPPSHAAVLTLVPLRAGRFPFIGAVDKGIWGKIVVEDPAVDDTSTEKSDAES